MQVSPMEFFTQCTLTSQDAPWKKPAGGTWLDGSEKQRENVNEQPDQEEQPVEVEVEVEDPVPDDDDGMWEVKNRLREAMPEVYWPMSKLGVDDTAFVDSQLQLLLNLLTLIIIFVWFLILRLYCLIVDSQIKVVTRFSLRLVHFISWLRPCLHLLSTVTLAKLLFASRFWLCFVPWRPKLWVTFSYMKLVLYNNFV